MTCSGDIVDAVVRKIGIAQYHLEQLREEVAQANAAELARRERTTTGHAGGDTNSDTRRQDHQASRVVPISLWR